MTHCPECAKEAEAAHERSLRIEKSHNNEDEKKTWFCAAHGRYFTDEEVQD